MLKQKVRAKQEKQELLMETVETELNRKRERERECVSICGCVCA